MCTTPQKQHGSTISRRRAGAYDAFSARGTAKVAGRTRDATERDVFLFLIPTFRIRTKKKQPKWR